MTLEEEMLQLKARDLFLENQVAQLLPFKEKSEQLETVINQLLERIWNPTPDLGYVVAGKVKPVTKKSVDVIPDLIVEVNSPEDLNTVKKREKVAAKIAKYQEKSVSIVCSITPATKSVAIYHPGKANPTQILDIKGELDGENIISGLNMKVDDIFH